MEIGVTLHEVSHFFAHLSHPPMSCDLLADNLPKYLLRSLLVLSRCFIVVTAHYTISDEFRLLSKVS